MVGNINQEIMRTIESLSINALKNYKKSFLHWSKSHLLIRIIKFEGILDRCLFCGECGYERHKVIEQLEVIEEFIFTLDYKFRHYYGILHKIDRQLALLEKIESEIIVEYISRMLTSNEMNKKIKDVLIKMPLKIYFTGTEVFFKVEIDTIDEAQAFLDYYKGKGIMACSTHRNSKHQIYTNREGGVN